MEDETNTDQGSIQHDQSESVPLELDLYNFDSFRFAICILKCCNGDDSVPFTDALCSIEFLKLGREQLTPCGIPFKKIFLPGVCLLEKIKTLKDVSHEIEADDLRKDALERLFSFFKMKGTHEENLKKVLKKRKWENGNSLTETDYAAVIAEHLLSKLAPGDSYTIDGNSKNKTDLCSCGCGVSIKDHYGNTGIGHEKVWHGFIDIVLSSHEGIDNVATIADASETTPKKRKVDHMEDDAKDDSPGGKSITEVKKAIPQDAAKPIPQAVAQTIVFSLLQKQRHPRFENHMVPNIIISPEEFQIILYDAEKDILLCSAVTNLFYPDFETLDANVIVVLWMVLHYRLFCCGFVGIDESVCKKFQSNFKQLVADKWDTYSKCLKSLVSSFPSVPQYSLNSFILRAVDALEYATKE